MDYYQKAIKVRKECESREVCIGETTCPYIKHCANSILFITLPVETSIETMVEVIKKEKWIVK